MKIFLISHVADADGVMPVILTDLAFENYDYRLLDIKDVDSFMLESFNNKLFDDYDKVFMTDLCVSEELAEKINNMEFRNKFQVLDHHIGSISLNKYDFIKVVDEANGMKESGTSLYYKYLLTYYPNDLLNRNSVKYMVNLVRLGDTWEWKKYNIPEARDLSTILYYYGNEEFIDNYKIFLRENNEFYFNKMENTLLKIDKYKKEDYINFIKDNIIIRDINGYKAGIVFAENYRSELGNELSEIYKDKIDFVMIINLNRSISFRCIKDNVDVNEIASLFGGGGHKKAAGAPLKEGTYEKLIDDFLKMNKE